MPLPPPRGRCRTRRPAPGDDPVVAAGRCNWCGADVDLSQPACPRCGAALKLPAAAHSGWTKLPARKDMAKLQIGNSSCQIEGVYVPVADMNLAAGDSVYFTHHVLLWKDPQVNITTMSLKGAWKRMFAGLPLIMTQAEGPGHIAFSKDDPGELIPVAHAARPARSMSASTCCWPPPPTSLMTGFRPASGSRPKTATTPRRTIPWAASWTASRPRKLPACCCCTPAAMSSCANWAPGQTILVKPTALVFKDPTVQMQLHFEHPGAVFTMWRNWGNRYLWLRLTGPGRVGIQSVFDRIEGESRNMTRWSNATATRW